MNNTQYESYISQGDSYIESKQYVKAIEEYTNAIRYNKDDATGYMARGPALTLIYKFKEALDDYEEVIRCLSGSHPFILMAYTARAQIFYDYRQYENAIREYKNAIQSARYFDFNFYFDYYTDHAINAKEKKTAKKMTSKVIKEILKECNKGLKDCQIAMENNKYNICGAPNCGRRRDKLIKVLGKEIYVCPVHRLDYL